MQEAEELALAHVRAAYRELRRSTDPRGHHLLAAIEVEHLSVVSDSIQTVRRLIERPSLRLVRTHREDAA
jgi:hypothetical protein